LGKFKGNKEDWLDDEKSVSGRAHIRTPKKGKPKVEYLEAEKVNGMVVEVFPNQCVVKELGTLRRLACTYRKAKLPTADIRERAPVAVGDLVHFEEISRTDGVIDGVSARTNSLSRPAPERAQRHVLVANVKKLVIVTSVANPEFSPGLVDRFIIAAEHQGIGVFLAINKADLLATTSVAPKLWENYSELGYSVGLVCAKTGDGLEAIRQWIGEDLTTFCGHSGVGKTSLLNSMLGKQIGRTGEVSEFTGKGQHTTTGAYLIEGTNLIDTPGVREFGLFGIEPEWVRDFFREFKTRECRDPECFHREEVGCAVKELPRYSSYRRIVESILEGT
jgi:ribosome biogenesis GTPase / thiamine phosphate phosphatase